MSKLLDNKPLMIHIVSEVAVIVGLTFYFNQKNKKLMAHIEDLSQRIEEQEDLLQKHEQIIKQIVGFINTQQTANQSRPSVSTHLIHKPPPNPPPPKRHTKKLPKVLSKQPTLLKEPPSSPPLRVSFANVSETLAEVVDNDNETEEDLDAELREELGDLIEPGDSLKKES
jgi:hypothetical protein